MQYRFSPYVDDCPAHRIGKWDSNANNRLEVMFLFGEILLFIGQFIHGIMVSKDKSADQTALDEGQPFASTMATIFEWLGIVSLFLSMAYFLAVHIYHKILKRKEKAKLKQELAKKNNIRRTTMNPLQQIEIDATEELRGVPEDSRRLRCEIASNRTVYVLTQWGWSDPVAIKRGSCQGAVGAPDEAKTAADVIHRIREQGDVYYQTQAGRKIYGGSVVDDANIYAASLRDLCTAFAELRLGSLASGIGFALGDDHTGERPTRPRGAPPPDSKPIAYASDWDESWEALAQEGYAVTEDAIEVRCWDIWQGGERTAWVRRVTGDTLA